MSTYGQKSEHMISPQKPKGYWKIKDNCLEAFKTCKTIVEFQKNFSGAYNSSRKYNWLEEFKISKEINL